MILTILRNSFKIKFKTFLIEIKHLHPLSMLFKLVLNSNQGPSQVKSRPNLSSSRAMPKPCQG